MSYLRTIKEVREQIATAADRLDAFFELPGPALAYRPADGGWTASEILEHVTLTSHYLLLIIRPHCAKAARRAAKQPAPVGESDLARLAPVGHPDAFPWIRPEHMEPTGTADPAAVRATMASQFAECVALLDGLPPGAGALVTVRMSVQALGRMDMYQWLVFLALHAQRHAVEIERIGAERAGREGGAA